MKRTNGEGTIWQDKKGLWHGELTLGYTNGVRDKKQFSSMDLEVLQKKMNDEKFRLNRNMVTQNNNFTVKEWLEFWLKTYKANSIKASTYDHYELAIKLHLDNKLANMKLDKVKSINIQQLYNGLFSKNYSTSTIKSIHKPLNQAFKQAINNELIYKNPCDSVIMPKREPKKSRAMTTDEQERFLKACNDSTYHNFFVFLLNTGMRCGEAMAITWNDVDFENMTIEVNKNISRIKSRDLNAEVKNIQIVETTKTESSNRIVPINKGCLAVLKKQKGKNIYIFSSKANTLLSHRNINRAFEDLLIKSEIVKLDETKSTDEKKYYTKSGLTVHSLRHTFATRLLEKSANMKAVSELLGHKGIQITMDTYSHVLPNLKTETINLLD